MNTIKAKTSSGEEISVNLDEAGHTLILGATVSSTRIKKTDQSGLGWKEGWTLRIVALGKGSRLPRGFKPAVIRQVPPKPGHFDPTSGPVYYVKK